MMNITLEISLEEVGRISLLLDREAEENGNLHDLQRKWDRLYVSLNNMPYNVLAVTTARTP